MPEDVGRPILTPNATQLEMTHWMGKRRLIRSQKNPLDKSTVVSIYPKDIPEEIKPTIEMGKYKIPYGTFEEPGVLVVCGSCYWKDFDVEQPILEISQSSILIAESIVKDYCNSMPEYAPDAHPGIFFVIGEHTSLEIKMRFKTKLEEVKAKQDNWYRSVVRLADVLWARTNGNPLTIMDDAKLAARSLNLNDKPWLRDYQMSKLVPCIACGSMRNPAYPVCGNCKSIDKSHPAAADLKFAV